MSAATPPSAAALSAFREIPCRGIVPGRVEGPALVSWDPVSFLGDLDIRSGRIVGDLPSAHGQCVAGTLLLMPTSRGSAGAWRFLYQMYKHGTHPLGMAFGGLPDPSVVQGAILAGIPVVAGVPEEIARCIANGQRVWIDGDAGIFAFDDRLR